MVQYYNSTAKVCAVFFAFSSTLLLTSIIRVVATSPGGIPEDREWDMPSTDASDATSSANCTDSDHYIERADEKDALIAVKRQSEKSGDTRKREITRLSSLNQKKNKENFTNEIIDRLTEYPEEVAHEDYRYLVTTEGTLISTQANKIITNKQDQKF